MTFRESKVWPELLGGLVTGDDKGTDFDLVGRTTALACAPDGQLFAIGTASDGIYIYRHESLIQRIKLERTISSLSFRADEKVLAAVSTAKGESGTRLSLFSLTSHGEAAQKKRSMVAETIAISQNGHWLATVEKRIRPRDAPSDEVAEEERIRLCDAASGGVTKEMPLKKGFLVTALTVSDEGKVQAFARERVWEVFASDAPKQLNVGPPFVVSGDGNWLVHPRKDGTAIEVTKLSTGESKPAIPPPRKEPERSQERKNASIGEIRKRLGDRHGTFAISHSGKVIAAYEFTTRTIDLFANPWLAAPHFTSEAGDGGLVSNIPCAAAPTSLAFGADDQLSAPAGRLEANNTLFAATRGGDLLVFDLTLGWQRFVRPASGARIMSMATSAKPPLLAMAMADQPVRLWGAVADEKELQAIAGEYPKDLKWEPLTEEGKAKLAKPLPPMDERTAAFWDAFWVTGRRVARLNKETASVTDLETAYAPLRAVLSDEGARDSLWEMKAMRERLKFWKMLAQPRAVSPADLAALRDALPGLEANERRIVERSGIFSPATPPAQGGY